MDHSQHLPTNSGEFRQQHLLPTHYGGHHRRGSVELPGSGPRYTHYRDERGFEPDSSSLQILMRETFAGHLPEQVGRGRLSREQEEMFINRRVKVARPDIERRAQEFYHPNPTISIDLSRITNSDGIDFKKVGKENALCAEALSQVVTWALSQKEYKICKKIVTQVLSPTLWDKTYCITRKVWGCVLRVLYLIATFVSAGIFAMVDLIVQAVKRRKILNVLPADSNIYGYIYGSVESLNASRV